MMLAGSISALIASALTTCAITIGIAGRKRGLGLSYALGTAVGLLVAAAPALAMLPLAVLALCVAITMPIDLLIISLREKNTPHSGLNGDQAKALLIDFELAGRGWFWATDRNSHLTYISETLALQLGKTAEDLIGLPLTALIGEADPSINTDGQRTLGFHLSARTAFSRYRCPRREHVKRTMVVDIGTAGIDLLWPFSRLSRQRL